MPRLKKNKKVGVKKKKKKNDVKNKKNVIQNNIQDENELIEKENLKYIKLINKIRSTTDEKVSNIAFEQILDSIKPRIQKIVSKFNIPGLDHADVYQESLYALKYKAIKDYDKKRGSGEGPASFERFAVLCIRRHLATEFKASFQNRKKVLNTASSLDQEKKGQDEDLSLISIIPSDTDSVINFLGDNELYKSFLTELTTSLSGFEKSVFSYYANGDTYEEIAEKINVKSSVIPMINVKSVDNALSRIKNKAKYIAEQNEEFKSLLPKKR